MIKTPIIQAHKLTRVYSSGKIEVTAAKDVDHILLADEPTGNLDSVTGQSIVELLVNLHAKRGVSIIVATHAIEIARHASRKIRLADGKIIEDL